MPLSMRTSSGGFGRGLAGGLEGLWPVLGCRGPAVRGGLVRQSGGVYDL